MKNINQVKKRIKQLMKKSGLNHKDELLVAQVGLVYLEAQKDVMFELKKESEVFLKKLLKNK